MIRAFPRKLFTGRTTLNLANNGSTQQKLERIQQLDSITKAHEQKTENKTDSIVHQNGLYYGKFTKEEYECARAFVTSQYTKLEAQIKGTHDVRENIGKIAQFPASAASSANLGHSIQRTPTIDSLSDLFRETIKTTGPISLSAYMRQCLTHPDLGYYTTRDPIDPLGGDFITSPEISTVFGEMIGIWLYAVWNSQGQPHKVNFIEFGPGKGTLIHDAMFVFCKFLKKKGKSVESRIWLIEASSVLRKEQWKTLCMAESAFETDADGFNKSVTKWGHEVIWVDTEKDISSSPQDSNYIIAHEFFDALPIKSFTRTEKGWRELLVEHTPSVVNTQQSLPATELINDNKAIPEELITEFHLTTSKKETPSSLIPKMSPRFAELPVGSRIEVCADAELYIKRITDLINDNKNGHGAALIIDYGLADEVPSNSLRGIYKHNIVSPFYRPGEVDLSIDVDFANIKALAEPTLKAFGPINQGDWLHTMGAGHRFDQLIKSVNSMANKESIYNAYLRLTDNDQMGRIYKFLALMPKDSREPIGFGGSI